MALSASDLTPEYRWNPDLKPAGQYIDALGRIVPRSAIRSALDQTIKAAGSEIRALAEALKAGNLTLIEWELAMREQLKLLHLATAALEKGGWAQLTQADFGRVGGILKREYGYLKNFANDIASGKQKLDGSFTRRADLYNEAARNTYYRFAEDGLRALGFDEERNILGQADHCDGCIEETDKGWVGIGELVPIGERLCNRNCQCSMEYRNSKTKETVQL